MAPPDEGTHPNVIAALIVAAIAVVAGFWLLLSGSTALGGVLLLAGALSSGWALRATRRP
jgi:hypothetical protein